MSGRDQNGNTSDDYEQAHRELERRGLTVDDVLRIQVEQAQRAKDHAAGVVDTGRWEEGTEFDGWALCTEEIPVWESNVVLWKPGAWGRNEWTLEAGHDQAVTADDLEAAARIIRAHEGEGS